MQEEEADNFGCFTEAEVEQAFQMLQCAPSHTVKGSNSGHIGAGHFCHAMANFGIPGFDPNGDHAVSETDAKVAALMGITDRYD